MALFTTADRDAVVAAIVVAATEGISSCTVAGQTVTARSVDDLRKLLEIIQSDLASSSYGGGIRTRQLVPPGCG